MGGEGVLTERPRRRLVLLAIAIIVAAVCVRLGVWQLDRLEQRRAFNARVRAALATQPVPLDEIMATGDPAYRRVTAIGTWDRAHEVILYGRALDGRPGNHVLTPLTTGDGRAVLVDRGWVPSDVADAPVSGPGAASTGQAMIEGLTLPSDDGDDVVATSGELPEQVRAVDVAALDAAIPATLVPNVYVLLQRQSPPQRLPVPAPMPELTEGPHLGYAVQWFAFAAIAVAGSVIVVTTRRPTTS